MRGQNTWSYRPYRPPMFDGGDIYICRVVPSADAIHCEWLDSGAERYDVYCRARDEGEFALFGTAAGTQFDITGLVTDTDYEFYVQAGEKTSRIRLARCGEAIGTVVNYLHPDDGAYSFSGNCLCSPSFVRHPDGYLLSSMDVYGSSTPQNLTLIFRSDDDGVTWHYVSELMPCFWGKLFVHKGDVYMVGCSTEYGDLLIGRSTDGGSTFGAPTVLLRGSGGKEKRDGVHKNPQNSLVYNGRRYLSVEWGNWNGNDYFFAPMVMSCALDDDMLIPENWSFTEPHQVSADPLAWVPHKFSLIEGTLAMSPDGKLLNVMRFGMANKKAMALRVDTDDPEAPLVYDRLINFPGNKSKFMIRYDEVSRRYYSICCYIYDWENANGARNMLTLVASDDFENWEIVSTLYDYRDQDPFKIGLQYVYFMFDGDDILYVCRTAMNNANNFHDSNYQTFHRIKNFRDLTAE